MAPPTMLTDILKLHFAGWPLARPKCLSSLIGVLCKVKTVHLTPLATAFRVIPTSPRETRFSMVYSHP